MQTSQYQILKNSNEIGGVLLSLLENLIITYYEYTGIENTAIAFDDIERALFLSNTAAIFKNKQGEIDCLPCAITEIDYKGKAKTVQLFALADFTKKVNIGERYVNGENCAVIYNNSARVSYFSILAPYIEKLSKIWKNSINNIELSKVFGLFQTSSENRNAVDNSLKSLIKNGYGVISCRDKALFTEITKFDLKIPYESEKYNADFAFTFQQMLNAVGINSNPNEKKERMLVDEVNSNNEFLERCDNSFYLYRKNALEKANKIFGTNLGVKKYGQNNIENERDNNGNGADNDGNVNVDEKTLQ